MPALGFSLWMVAVGVILMLVTQPIVHGINIPAVGVLVIVSGSIGVILSLLFWTPFAPFNSKGWK